MTAPETEKHPSLVAYEAAIARGAALVEGNEDLRLFVEHRGTECAERAIATCCCRDCGISYGSDAWIECVLTDEDWSKVCPEDGLLCITCIARRAKRLGLTDVPVRLTGTEAIRVATQRESFDEGWNCAKARIGELEAALSRRETADTRAAVWEMILDALSAGRGRLDSDDWLASDVARALTEFDQLWPSSTSTPE